MDNKYGFHEDSLLHIPICNICGSIGEIINNKDNWKNKLSLDPVPIGCYASRIICHNDKCDNNIFID